MGIVADLLGVVATVWRLVWANGHMLVSDTFANEEDIYQDIASTMLSLLSLHPFTESRWLTIGRSCRSLVIGLLFGLEDLVQYVLGMPGAMRITSKASTS